MGGPIRNRRAIAGRGEARYSIAFRHIYGTTAALPARAVEITARRASGKRCESPGQEREARRIFDFDVVWGIGQHHELRCPVVHRLARVAAPSDRLEVHDAHLGLLAIVRNSSANPTTSSSTENCVR